jgi:hypothetical protein
MASLAGPAPRFPSFWSSLAFPHLHFALCSTFCAFPQTSHGMLTIMTVCTLPNTCLLLTCTETCVCLIRRHSASRHKRQRV